MARIRSLKPEAFQSETLSEVSVDAERSFYGMSTQADDRGRLADKPVVINAALWAVRSERRMERGEAPHTTKDLEGELEALVSVGLVCRYVGCDGKRYLHLVSWDDHQKVDNPGKSRAARCPHHLNARDYCAKHGKEPCPATPREPSPRASELDDNTSDAVEDPREEPEDTPEVSRASREGSSDSRETLDSPHEDSLSAREGYPLDLVPRTYDLGPTTNTSSPATPSRESESEPESDGSIPGLDDFASSAKRPEPGSDDDPDWRKFWDLWPKKVGKSEARKAWAGAVKKVAPFVIIAGADRYRQLVAKERRTKQHIKDPSGWLNNDRWSDEINLEPADGSGSDLPERDGYKIEDFL